MPVISLNGDNFDEFTNSPVPVLVDFYAPWCGSCSAVAPVVERLGSDPDGFGIAKVNIDEEAELARRFGVQSIPTFAVFRNGEIADRRVGVLHERDIIELLRRADGPQAAGRSM